VEENRIPQKSPSGTLLTSLLAYRMGSRTIEYRKPKRSDDIVIISVE